MQAGRGFRRSCNSVAAPAALQKTFVVIPAKAGIQ